MSIQDEIERIKTNIANAYSVVTDMDGTLPEVQNSDNLALAIANIPVGGSCGFDVIDFSVYGIDIYTTVMTMIAIGLESTVIEQDMSEILSAVGTALNDGKIVLFDIPMAGGGTYRATPSGIGVGESGVFWIDFNLTAYDQQLGWISVVIGVMPPGGILIKRRNIDSDTSGAQELAATASESIENEVV